jgi:hypothetical protein
MRGSQQDIGSLDQLSGAIAVDAIDQRVETAEKRIGPLADIGPDRPGAIGPSANPGGGGSAPVGGSASGKRNMSLPGHCASAWPLARVSKAIQTRTR